MHRAERERRKEADLCVDRGPRIRLSLAEMGESCPSSWVGEVTCLGFCGTQEIVIHDERERPLDCKGGHQAAEAGFGET